MQVSRNILPVGSLESFGNLSFDSAEYVQLRDNYDQPLKDFIGIRNVTRGGVVSVPKRGYRLIQHNTVHGAIYDILRVTNLEVIGRVDDYGNNIRMDLAFKDVGIKDDKTGIQLGFRVLNSYDKKYSLRFELFAFRNICANGMSFGDKLGTRVLIKHRGGELQRNEIKEKFVGFLSMVWESQELLKKKVDSMMLDPYELEATKILLQTLIKSKKHRIEIESRLPHRIDGLVTRWDVYNAITNYITYETGLKLSAVETLEMLSRKVMDKKLNKLVEVKND